MICISLSVGAQSFCWFCHVAAIFFPETMGKLNQFQIILDKPGGVYHPGEVLSGHVIVDLKEELKMRGNLKHFRLSL